MAEHERTQAVPAVSSKAAFERLTGVTDPDTIILFGEHPFPDEFPFVGRRLAEDWIRKGIHAAGESS